MQGKAPLAATFVHTARPGPEGPGARDFPGEHTRPATPVPIPNTAVKRPGPMVVPTGARVGHRRGFMKGPVAKATGPFRLRPALGRVTRYPLGPNRKTASIRRPTTRRLVPPSRMHDP